MTRTAKNALKTLSSNVGTDTFHVSYMFDAAHAYNQNGRCELTVRSFNALVDAGAVVLVSNDVLPTYKVA